jgi:proteasome accessory factor C
MASRAEAGERLRRLLAILSWLARRQRVPVAELAERFAVTPAELSADLELAACCGLPPYTPDQLMEIVVDDEEVSAHLGAELSRPRRLTALEGFSLAVAARSILAVRGADEDGALGRALEKLEAVLGEGDRLVVDLDDPPYLAEVRASLGGPGSGSGPIGRKQLEVEYHSASRDEVTTRVVDPVDVFTLGGKWYLDGYCHRSEGIRRFRVDRIRSLRLTQTEACHGLADDPGSVEGPFVPSPDMTVVTVVADAQGAWLAETVPVLDVEDLEGGGKKIRLAVAGAAWFDRLLLQLGPHAEVVDPPEMARSGAEAAKRVLARYQ